MGGNQSEMSIVVLQPIRDEYCCVATNQIRVFTWLQDERSNQARELVIDDPLSRLRLTGEIAETMTTTDLVLRIH